MSSPTTVPDPQGEGCLRCGGRLDPTTDDAFLHCHYCGTAHQVIEGESVPASMPSAWCSSRDAREVLRKTLRSRGIKASVTTEVDLWWLVFWRIRGKLVGWQFYQKRPDPVVHPDRDEERRRNAQLAAERVEELVARDVDVSLPACDTRSFDLVGIADRVDQLDWVSFSAERIGQQSHPAAVVVPRAVALRRAELLRRGGLVPRGATGAVQRLSLLRSTARLLYYPVWRLHFTVAGEPGLANIDAVRARVLGGKCTGAGVSPAPGWYAAAAASGWLAALHPAFPFFGVAGWALHRGREAGVNGGLDRWGRWLSEELGPRSRRTLRLDP